MKKRIAIALGIATVLTALAGVAYAAKQTGYEGAWESVDPGPDHSRQWVWIANFVGMHEVLYYDELCGSCTGTSGFGPPCTYVGAGTVDNEGNLSTDDGVLYCLWQEGAELLVKDYPTTFSLLGDGSMTDDYLAVWTRSSDKDPSKVIEAWTQPKPTPPPPPPVVDEDEDGYSVENGDCNDLDATIHPGAEDEPDEGFVDTNCDGMDGDEGRALFVSETGEDSLSAGTRENPMRTISYALARAASKGKDHVYVHEGSYTEQVELRNGLSIWGGFARGTGGSWQRSSDYQTSISWAQSSSGRVLAMFGTNLTSRTTVADLTISAGRATEPGESAYGVYCANCTGLILERNAITAGAGGNGVYGANGIGGETGSDGFAGMPGAEDDLIDAYGGYGAAKYCTDGSRSGGDGGRGGRGEENGLDGAAGKTAGGIGGTGGVSSDPGGDGFFGGAGPAGSAGVNGAGGFGGGIVYGYWLGQHGANGTPATSGHGGGGGGGGGGQDVFFDAFDGTGNGGGGGGSGGCGGSPGKGGTAGGGSFGVFLVNSEGALIRGNVISSGQGGTGGTGGTGGPGGSGGAGGPGAREFLDEVGAGGDGGPGGPGGRGGHGGGGAGGVSYGVYTTGGAASLIDNEFLVGAGGAGGSSPGNRGTPGARGATN